MATLAAGSNVNSFIGFGQTVTITTSHNVNGRYYFVPQNAAIPDMAGAGKQFGPMPMSVTVGPFDSPGTLYIENYPGSASSLTYTVDLGTAYPVNATTLAASSTVSGTGFSSYMAAPPSIGTTTPGVVKTSNLQATYTDSTGTPGNVTNNSPRGRVAVAAAGTSVVVTNSLVTAASSVFAVITTNDSTAVIKNVVPAAGSFTITLNAAATAQTSIDFFVVN